ncbi:MAG: substrate-binding domain-containing protein, partial [Acidobacteriaceae bacterium]|nr:substrate-binding domain-containing protein [Acidobacteriaceae bacterium]
MKQERVLACVLLLEIALFSVTGVNFFTRVNFFEVIRLSAELGLLSLALTPVIISGGIDLSVGSAMGMAAVVFGALWHDAGLPVWAAASATLATGALAGAVNALPIALLRIPPLIVTLGTYSLFRGFAEGFTGGVVTYTNFPRTFLELGQGYLWGVVPDQTLVFMAFIGAYWALLHRSVIGRALYAMGFNYEGARYAGIPVRQRIGLVYVLSGLVASAAAIIYVAHIGEAKPDAGTGYELMAITAVVLGGTSIFGGRGTIAGTVLGLFVIVVLQNGLRLSGLPAELTGILTGLLLVVTISIDHVRSATVREPAAPGTFRMKNSHVAILSGVILIAALLIAGSNWMVVSTLRERLPQAQANTIGRRTVVGMMPKAKGDPYFVSCRQGAEEAAKQTGIELIWDGPTDLDPAKQNEVVEGWITRGVSTVAVSVENRAAISTVLRKARSRGIHVITWDSDAEADARDFFINQATPQGIGYTLMDRAAKLLGAKGEFAIITASLTATNQNEWIHFIQQRLNEKYPAMKLAVTRPGEGDRQRAFSETQTILKVYPNVKLIMGIETPAVPGAGEAVKQSGRTDVKVIGLSLPNICKPYIHSGVVDSIVL